MFLIYPRIKPGQMPRCLPEFRRKRGEKKGIKSPFQALVRVEEKE